MMNETEIVERALVQLADHTGLTGTWNLTSNQLDKGIDGAIDLTFGSTKTHFYVEVKKELREHHLLRIIEQAKIHKPLMVVAERIFPKLKEKLRERKIGYLDGAGNIYLHTEGNYIWLDGRKNIEQQVPITNRAFTKTGLRTVFYLLWHQEAINMPYRALARATGVALGNIKNIILGLEQSGFILQINEKQMVLQNKKALLERWIAGYKETLKPLLLIGKYRLNKPADLMNLDTFPVRVGDTVWGGEPGAELITNYLNAKELTVYTTEAKPALMQKWRLLPDAKGNIQFYEKFWQDDSDLTQPIAPALLIYADLVITDDPRNIETAERIYNQHLKQEYEQY
jgi:hypothetical protein